MLPQTIPQLLRWSVFQSMLWTASCWKAAVDVAPFSVVCVGHPTCGPPSALHPSMCCNVHSAAAPPLPSCPPVFFPQARLEPIDLASFEPPTARRFALRQLELIEKEGMSKRAAAALVESEFAAQQRRAAAEAGSRHCIIDQIQVCAWGGCMLRVSSFPFPCAGFISDTLAAGLESSTSSRLGTDPGGVLFALASPAATVPVCLHPPASSSSCRAARLPAA